MPFKNPGPEYVGYGLRAEADSQHPDVLPEGLLDGLETSLKERMPSSDPGKECDKH